MKDVGCSRGAADLLVDARVVDILMDLLALGFFQVQLLAGNVDFDYDSESTHGGYNVRLTEYLHRLVVVIFSHRESLTSEIPADVNHHSVTSLDPDAVYSSTYLEHVILISGTKHPSGSTESITCLTLVVTATIGRDSIHNLR